MHITLSNGDPLVANLVTTKTEDATRKEEHASGGRKTPPIWLLTTGRGGGDRRHQEGGRLHQLGCWPPAPLMAVIKK